MMKKIGRKKEQGTEALTIADRLGAAVEAKLLEKKRALAEEEARRRAAEEARRREEQKSFAELLEESELDWRKFK
ncbi:DUF3886 domain-containing protein [Geobacillus sp. FSL K6-0789]|uniref:DUF3886 domain-containing protein n=1 Tax=Geobacillus stearothermophilus TaxID=1422 RepID=A0A0K9HD33_GEOSE|nr:DUF3886 domain-containing protein [Geobacillus stearothermophilus]KMY56789.1 hypothetical protein AA905_15690 [Geobacillus stearothermophilus]KMY56835.1 hypothetical protein AA904_15335 [Geobacillus stearothermophilus]KOR93797.1 hypothetical protein N231_10415 [Geobacillus stearothermophilus ATCC 12980]KYD25793.1 hypothetical protein B4109_1917 [Geobacillus stearothermophilus]MED3664319.1 DUF3886 domain-containing protein [Geobacillus stearothermophilus]